MYLISYSNKESLIYRLSPYRTTLVDDKTLKYKINTFENEAVTYFFIVYYRYTLRLKALRLANNFR